MLPQLENAVLAGHDVILLGERGQAKTRMIRSLVGLLDEWLPIVAHSEINDDPYRPVSRFAKDLVAESGDDTPIGVGPPQRPLRGEAGHPRHLHRRPHRRGRPDPGGRGPVPLRRADHPLRPGASAQPGHLRRQRAPGPGRADPGRPPQRARGAGRPDPRPPGAPAAGHRAGGHGQPGGLHQPGPDHHPAEGPLRRPDPHPLPPGRRHRAPHRRARGRPAGQRGPGRRAGAPPWPCRTSWPRWWPSSASWPGRAPTSTSARASRSA